MKFSIFFSNVPGGFYKNFICLWLVLFGICPALAYDNSVYPQIELENEARKISWISTHPDSERWLITECTDRIEPPHEKCYVFVYNLKTRGYQRFDLPGNYYYSEAQYSPTGQHIVAVRAPLPANDSHEELERVAGESEILLMGANGHKRRMLNIPKGRVMMPAMSPNESKIAYWSAGMVRPPGSKTFMSKFDLYEYDLRSETNQLCSGLAR